MDAATYAATAADDDSGRVAQTPAAHGGAGTDSNNSSGHSNDDGHAVLVHAKHRLEKENQRLKDKLEEEATARMALELNAQRDQSELSFVKGVIQEDVATKVDKLEQERRRLLATIQQQNEQLQAKDAEVEALKKTKAVLAEERDRLLVQLDDETSDKADEAAGRRKATSQAKELKMRLEVEQAKVSDLTQQIITWRSKAQTAETELAAVALVKDKGVRQETQAQAALKELQAQLRDAQEARRNAEETTIVATGQLDDLKERLDEDAEELATVSRAKRQLEMDLAEAKSVTSREIQVREKALAELRERNKNDLTQLTAEVESSRATIATLRTQLKETQSRCDNLAQQLEEETRAKQSTQREAERLTLRGTDQQRAFQEVYQQATALREETASLTEQLAKAKASMGDLDVLDALERAKAQTAKKLQDALLENEKLSRDNASLTKRAALQSQELQENNEFMEEQALAISRAEEKLRKIEFQLAEAETLRKREQEARESVEHASADLTRQVRDLSNQLLLIESTMSLEGPRTRRQFDEQITQLQAQLDAAEQKISDMEKHLRKANKANSEAMLRLTESEKARLQYEDLVAKHETHTRKLQTQLDEMENRASDQSIALRRAQRESEAASDRALKMERELNRTKSKLLRTSAA